VVIDNNTKSKPLIRGILRREEDLLRDETKRDLLWEKKREKSEQCFKLNLYAKKERKD